MVLFYIVNALTFSGICLLLTHANTVTYIKNENQYIDYQPGDILAESSAVVSHRHCSQLRTADANCTTLNYNHDTSNCQLLKLGVVNLIEQSGYTGYIAKVEGQIGLWPLNDEHQGENLIAGKTDIELYDVTYNDVSNEWMSTPVRFSGTSSSYGEFINVDDTKVSGSFAFIAAVYREQTRNFPLLEWSVGSGFATHIWIHLNKLYIAMRFASCVDSAIFYSTTVSNNQWTTLAISFNNDNGILSMWMDGQEEKTQRSSCDTGYQVPLYAYVNKRPSSGGSRIIGHITCMGLYDTAVNYDDMIRSTRPFC